MDAQPTERHLKDRLMVACERVVVYSWFPNQRGYLEAAKMWAGVAIDLAEQLHPDDGPQRAALLVGQRVGVLERTLSDRSPEARVQIASAYAQQDVATLATELLTVQ